jgi:hypothetical protein
MMGSARLELADITASLTPAAVLSHYGIEVKHPLRGDLFGSTCPRCRHRKSPRALVMSRETGRWTCYACVRNDGRPLAGDLLSFIAECEGLSTRGEEFAKVASIAADIAGITAVDASPEERARRRQAHREAMERRDRELRESAMRKRLESVVAATAHWTSCARRHESGEIYLAERGVREALEMGLVRFDLSDRGSIATPLFSSGGDVVNVIRRRLPPDAPTADDRFRPLPGRCALGTYGNSIADIQADRDVVLCEGFFDALSAALAWRGSALVIGARSASDARGGSP